ncbi:MAG: glycosyltransferase [Anaerolineales bacterium]|nr:glycosyltransferase [Anaerolineales bacterium]
MRVLFVHSGSDLYGASRSLLRLSSRLVKEGVAVKVVLPYDGPLVLALCEKGVSVIIQRNLPIMERQQARKWLGSFRLLMNVFLSTIDLWKLAKEFKPHLIHTMTAVILSPGLVAWFTGIPHIWHIREWFGEFGKLWWFYQKYIVWLSARVICVSTPVAEQFELYGSSKKIQVIHNGFPVDEFSAINADRVSFFRSKYIVPGISYLIGVVGRIKFQRKGQEVFVRGAHLLHDKFPNARFLCIGSPFPGNESHLDSLLELIHNLALDDYVIYTGDVEDIKAAIAGLDILVLSSVQPEPFAGTVVEAMALSRPVVATAVGGSIEQVVDGVTGYLVKPGDPESMAAGIEKLLESPGRRRMFGENGYHRFLEKFEFEPFLQRILALYEDVSSRAR